MSMFITTDSISMGCREKALRTFTFNSSDDLITLSLMPMLFQILILFLRVMISSYHSWEIKIRWSLNEYYAKQ